jgi:hypothetical protein
MGDMATFEELDGLLAEAPHSVSTECGIGEATIRRWGWVVNIFWVNF